MSSALHLIVDYINWDLMSIDNLIYSKTKCIPNRRPSSENTKKGKENNIKKKWTRKMKRNENREAKWFKHCQRFLEFIIEKVSFQFLINILKFFKIFKQTMIFTFIIHFSKVTRKSNWRNTKKAPKATFDLRER